MCWNEGLGGPLNSLDSCSPTYFAKYFGNVNQSQYHPYLGNKRLDCGFPEVTPDTDVEEESTGSHH